jgi:hypothetical protein
MDMSNFTHAKRAARPLDLRHILTAAASAQATSPTAKAAFEAGILPQMPDRCDSLLASIGTPDASASFHPGVAQSLLTQAKGS